MVYTIVEILSLAFGNLVFRFPASFSIMFIYLLLYRTKIVLFKIKPVRTLPCIGGKLYSANQQPVFSIFSLLRMVGKDCISSSATSMHIYKLACCCGVDYIGPATRCRAERMQVDPPTWLEKGGKNQ